MVESRRGFLKKLGTATAVVAVGTTALIAKGEKSDDGSLSNGVVVGESPKKEILYKKTEYWEEYYSSAK